MSTQDKSAWIMPKLPSKRPPILPQYTLPIQFEKEPKINIVDKQDLFLDTSFVLKIFLSPRILALQRWVG
jgi:hypothetical protein